jgi:XTP/dITP diphosphohydrolase
MDILISSRNEDKIREIRSIFNSPEFNLKTLDKFPNAPNVEEDGNTLYENAFKKAVALSKFTGLATISDDTGLEVQILNGKPGVFSARYAGRNASYEENVEKLLEEVKGIPKGERKAQFRCVAVFYHPSGMTIWEEGIVQGIILNERRGRNGFGYDPVFYLPEIGKTFAEMSEEEKNEISHRGKAFRKLYASVKNKLPLFHTS